VVGFSDVSTIVSSVINQILKEMNKMFVGPYVLTIFHSHFVSGTWNLPSKLHAIGEWGERGNFKEHTMWTQTLNDI
jgi:hypothetical protein